MGTLILNTVNEQVPFTSPATHHLLWLCAFSRQRIILPRASAPGDACGYGLDPSPGFALADRPGPGARCIDPVSHTFSYDGRTWLFNQDWGSVLEIPSDYIVEDDPVQAELSFHGTRAFSPDSLILVSFYAGFQCVPDEESRAFLRESLTEDGFTVISWDVPDGVVTVRARSPQGINYFGRHLPADGDGVERAVSVQYPDGKTDDAKDVLQMAIRYPAGPHGNVFRGEAL